MSKFHSTVSRRTFMKGLGLAGAGLGAAAAAAPVFRDLDEVVASPGAGWKRPWWVKELEVDKPTIEIDWQMMQRWDQTENLHLTQTIEKYIGVGEYAKLSARGSELKKQALQAGAKISLPKNRTSPGITLRDEALAGASGGKFSAFSPQSYISYLPDVSSTPEKLGVPRWQGTPEENTRMVRAAMRFLGAGLVGVFEIKPGTTQKLIYKIDRAEYYSRSKSAEDYQYCKRYEFEDVDQAYETTGIGAKYVIPNKCRTLIAWTVPMARATWRTAPSRIRDASNSSRYRLMQNIQWGTQRFLGTLGYQGLGPPKGNPNGLIPAGAATALSGLGETNRINNYITPEEGNITGGPWGIMTDLPLAPTKPIDAGMFRFCHTCKKCAESCPSGAVQFDDEPSWECQPFASPGHKAFYKDDLTCRIWTTGECPSGCGICFGVCTFNTNLTASIHEVIKTTVATTSIFNGFLAAMSDTFGYGLKDADYWWNAELPSYGYDTTIGGSKGPL